ncbi:MAG: hypothetical protein WAN46_13005 [Gammaproteobacteria bacterium]|jgi:hypothetical protein
MTSKAMGLTVAFVLTAGAGIAAAEELGDAQNLPEILASVTSYQRLSDESMYAIKGASIASSRFLVQSNLLRLLSQQRVGFDLSSSRLALAIPASFVNITGFTFLNRLELNYQALTPLTF